MTMCSTLMRAFRSAKLREATGIVALLTLATAPLAGCGVNREIAGPPPTSDGRLRHPIALVDQPTNIDIFPKARSGRLDIYVQNQIATFVDRYKHLGHGPISITAPANGPGSRTESLAIQAIKRELARNGAEAPVTVNYYPIQNPALASPVRLSFDGLKAKVVNRCGDWPNDLASASSVEGWKNQTYWNFGCANQNMLAAQTADPRDFASPQGETPPDVVMRMRGITSVRKGSDPATSWSVHNSSIGNVGG